MKSFWHSVEYTRNYIICINVKDSEGSWDSSEDSGDGD